MSLTLICLVRRSFKECSSRTSLFKNPTNVLKSDCLIGAQVKLQKRLRVLCMQPICKCGSEISLLELAYQEAFGIT